MKNGLKIAFLVVLVILVIPSFSFGLELPWGPNNFSYSAVVHPVVFDRAAPICKPIGVGSIREGRFSLEITLPRFERPVDLYVAMTCPGVEYPYLLWSDNSVRQISDGLRPWKQNVQGPISEGIFWGALPQGIPEGRYEIFLAVVPANEQNFQNYFCWETFFEVSQSSSQTSSSQTPMVSINFPRNTVLTIGSILALDVQVTNPQNLTLLEFFLDGNLLMQQLGIPSQAQYFFYYHFLGLAAGPHQLTVQAKGGSNSLSADSLGFNLNPDIRRQAVVNVLGPRNGEFCQPTNSSRVSRWQNLPIFLEVSPDVINFMGLERVQQAAQVFIQQIGIPIVVRPNVNSYVWPSSRPIMESAIFVRGPGEDLGDYFDHNLSYINEYVNYFCSGSYVPRCLERMDCTILAHWQRVSGMIVLGISNGNNCDPQKLQELLGYELVSALGIWGDDPEHRSWGSAYMTGYVNGRLDPVFGEALKILYWELGPGFLLPREYY